MQQFTYCSSMPVSADKLWEWHARPGALERLMPPWDKVRGVERSGGLEDGSRVTLSVPFGPIRIRWVSRYRDCVPGSHFVDEQIRGPFARWIHTHATIPTGPQTSTLEDRIEYALPGGAAGRLLAPLVVEQRLASMFRYRHDTLRADLIDHGRYEARPRLSVAMTGASGLLGSALRAFLTTGGHRVIRLVRRPSSEPDTFTWDVERGIHAPERLPAIDAAIHFAGESIAGGRWTERRKAGIRHSRVTGTQTLATSLARLASPPKALLCASAIGFYGSRSDEVTEQDGPGQGFLAEVCREWEAAAGPAVRAGIRVVHLRIGLVLSPAGGLLALLLPLFRAGLGGPVGSGTQGISWIGLDDVVGAFHHALQTETLWGPVNATAPTPVSSREFATTLGHVLGRPAVLPAPALGVKLIMGSEMATETALSGARVLPERLLASGLAFRHRTLAEGLRNVLGK